MNLEGMKTYTGLAVAILGFVLKLIGIEVVDGEVTEFVTNAMQVIGLGFAWYGRKVTKGN